MSSVSLNLNNEVECRKAYINYYVHGNTGGYSASDMGKIASKYSQSEINKWLEGITTLSQDTTEYQMTDDEKSDSQKAGAKAMNEATGYDGDNSGMNARAVGDGVAAGVTTAGAVGGLIKGGSGVWSAGKSLVTGGGKEALGKVSTNIIGTNMLRISCASASAVGIAYVANKPNSAQVNACVEATNQIGAIQGSMNDTQADIEEATSKADELAEEGSTLQEEANENIEKEKTDYDFYTNSYITLKEKIDGGEKLTEDEQKMYEECIKYMTETGQNIVDIQNESSETMNDINSDIEDLTDSYTSSQESIEEYSGALDAVSKFDETTQNACYTESTAQAINGATGAVSGTKLGIIAAAEYVEGSAATATGIGALFGGKKLIDAIADTILAGSALAGAAMSAAGANEQHNFAGEAGKTIEIRKQTQTINEELSNFHTENLELYTANVDLVQNATVEIPDDIEPPEDNAEDALADNLTNGEPDVETLNMFGMPVENNQNSVNTNTQTSQNEQNTNNTQGVNGVNNQKKKANTNQNPFLT